VRRLSGALPSWAQCSMWRNRSGSLGDHLHLYACSSPVPSRVQELHPGLSLRKSRDSGQKSEARLEARQSDQAFGSAMPSTTPAESRNAPSGAVAFLSTKREVDSYIVQARDAPSGHLGED